MEAFNYMEDAVAESDLSSMLEEYHKDTGTREKTYEMFEANLNGIYQEVEANGFNEEQAEKLLKYAADLETGNAELTEFTPVNSDELPPPPNGAATEDKNSPSVSLMSNSDISARDLENTG